ncbi:hypothetical protein ACWCV5_27900 [Streptomyces tubercidicus]
MRLFAVLAAQGVPASEADDLVAAVKVGGIALGLSEVAELLFEDGWDEAVMAARKALLHAADREWAQRGGRAAGTAQLAVHLADARQRERADLVRLEAFVRGTVLPRTSPHTTEWRRVLEALGEAGGLCTARAVNSDGDVVVCTREAGHYDPEDLPGFMCGTSDGTPGGWHKVGGVIWSDASSSSTPHQPVSAPGEKGR